MTFDLYACKNTKLLDNKQYIEKTLKEACKILNCKILKKSVKKFKPFGLNVCYILSTSHMVYSSWPEFGTALIDVSICASPKKVLLKKLFEKKLRADKVVVKKVERRLNK